MHDSEVPGRGVDSGTLIVSAAWFAREKHLYIYQHAELGEVFTHDMVVLYDRWVHTKGFFQRGIQKREFSI
jgi:hypothetical protein